MGNQRACASFASFSSLAVLVLAAIVIVAIPVANPPGGWHSSERRATGDSSGPVAEAYGRLPLSFEANQGQTDGSVKFLSRGTRRPWRIQ